MVGGYHVLSVPCQGMRAHAHTHTHTHTQKESGSTGQLYKVEQCMLISKRQFDDHLISSLILLLKIMNRTLLSLLTIIH